jgi:hypothetical protein
VNTSPACPLCPGTGTPFKAPQWFTCCKCKMRFLNKRATWASPRIERKPLKEGV